VTAASSSAQQANCVPDIEGTRLPATDILESLNCLQNNLAEAQSTINRQSVEILELQRDQAVIRRDADWPVSGTIVLSFRSDICPAGFLRMGPVSLEVRNGDDLDRYLRSNGLYDVRNIRDGSEVVDGYDAVSVFACMRS
jgi:hypothetical protein